MPVTESIGFYGTGRARRSGEAVFDAGAPVVAVAIMVSEEELAFVPPTGLLLPAGPAAAELLACVIGTVYFTNCEPIIGGEIFE